MGAKLSNYIKAKYPNTKSDMSTVFMERCLSLNDSIGMVSMINIPVWMFLLSYEKLRKSILENNTYINMVHAGRGIFGSDFGSTAFVIAKCSLPKYKGCYYRLFDKQTEVEAVEVREQALLARKGRYVTIQNNYSKIPGSPVAYWLKDSIIHDFSTYGRINDDFFMCYGLLTGHDDGFLFSWQEVADTDILFNCNSVEEFKNSGKKYAPLCKGGQFRRWYGNYDLVVRYDDVGIQGMSQYPKYASNGQSHYFKSGLTWTEVCMGQPSLRYMKDGSIFSLKSPSIFTDDKNKLLNLLGYLNTNVATYFVQMLNPTMSCGTGVIGRLMTKGLEKVDQEKVLDCIRLSQKDWDSFETSWDFKKHPIVQYAYFTPRKIQQEQQAGFQVLNTLQQAYESWARAAEERFNQLKANEEELNRIFIDIYGLQDELTPEVADKDVTVRKADLGRDIRSLVSYAVGCMLGRYSIYKDGLMFAGGEWSEQPFLQALWDDAGMQYVQAEGMQPMMDLNPQKVVMPDADGILPITDDDYFGDDIVTMFVNWVKVVFGANELEENLKFIARALYPGGGGSARDLIRQYFLNDFYKDHLKIYQKRPIYWLFDAGKKNSFKCLIYLHRYQPDTVARVRTDYVHEMQARYRTAIEELTRRVDTVGGSERVHLQKQLTKIQGQEEELRKYEEKIHHYADMMLPLDLDDGVKVNYVKLQDVLAPIK